MFDVLTLAFILFSTLYVAIKLDKGVIVYWLLVPFLGGHFLVWLHGRGVISYDTGLTIATICDVIYVVCMGLVAYRVSQKPDFSHIIDDD